MKTKTIATILFPIKKLFLKKFGRFKKKC